MKKYDQKRFETGILFTPISNFLTIDHMVQFFNSLLALKPHHVLNTQKDRMTRLATQFNADTCYSVTLDDTILLYGVILMLYHEGVEPSRAEVLFKLRELEASHQLLNAAVPYYRSNPSWYSVVENDNIMIHLRNEPECFKGWVNMKSPLNIYSPEIWSDFIEYIHNEITHYGTQLDLHRGNKDKISNNMFCHTRYALSKYIKSRGPERIRNMRIGNIAHLIQLAIHQGVLRYDSTTIVPGALSVEVLQGHRYVLNMSDPELLHTISIIDPEYYIDLSFENGILSNPSEDSTYSCKSAISSVCSKSAPTSNGVVSQWGNENKIRNGSNAKTREHVEDQELDLNTEFHEIECIMTKLLNEHEKILMSQVRSLILTRFARDIRPADYGFGKLSDMLTERFSHICRLVRHRNRHVYLEKVADGSSAPAPAKVSKLGYRIHTLSNVVTTYSMNMYRPSQFRSLGDVYLMTVNTDTTRKCCAWGKDDIMEIQENYVSLRNMITPSN